MILFFRYFIFPKEAVKVLSYGAPPTNIAVYELAGTVHGAVLSQYKTLARRTFIVPSVKIIMFVHISKIILTDRRYLFYYPHYRFIGKISELKPNEYEKYRCERSDRYKGIKGNHVLSRGYNGASKITA